MANIITGIRILCGILIMIFPTFSKEYYVLYLLGGFTDTIDGTIARKQGKATNFGAKFDTIADVVFGVAVFIKIVHDVIIPQCFIIWIIFIAIVKLMSIFIGIIRHHKLLTIHSKLNKLAGIMVFILLLFIGSSYVWQKKTIILSFVCLVASVAAIQEFIFILNGKNIE